MRARQLSLLAILIAIPAALAAAPCVALAADGDQDGIADESDACPLENGKGMANGCPPVDVRTNWLGRTEADGFRFGYLKIRADPGARVVVECSASTTCPRRRSVSATGRVQRLGQFRGLLAPRGMRVTVYVTREGHVGAFYRYTLRQDFPLATRRCIEPGSLRPRRACDGTPVNEAPPPAPPPWLDPFPFVRILGRPVGAATQVGALRVEHAGRGSTIGVTCRGRGCPYRTRSFRAFGKRAASMRLPRFARRVLRPRSVVEVRVTRPALVGLYVRFRIRRGSAPARLERCLLPGMRRPSTCPVRP